MNRRMKIIGLIFMVLVGFGTCRLNGQVSDSPRLLILMNNGSSSSEQQSFIRLILFSNEFDIKGFVYNSPESTTFDAYIPILKAYKKVYPNLQLYDNRYQQSDVLTSLFKAGNPGRGASFIGENHDTEGSDWIIETADESQDNLNIAVWGGQTDLVQALWKVKNTRTYDDYFAFISHLRVYDCNDRDGLSEMIRTDFPELFYILDRAPEGTPADESVNIGFYSGGDESLSSSEWLAANVLSGNGPLADLYMESLKGSGGMQEKYSTSWLFFLPSGLQDPAHPEWGGFGGRFNREKENVFLVGDDFAGGEISVYGTVYRWREYYQADFANRMQWCVRHPSQVNHPPRLVLNNDDSRETLLIDASEGETVTISSIGTDDVDGDSLSYLWWIYPEAETAHQCPEMWPIDQPDVAVELPMGEAGNEMHLIFQVTDNGEPALTRFRRVIFRIGEEEQIGF